MQQSQSINTNQCTFQKGNIVLAKCENCQPWPAVITTIMRNNIYRVKFYGESSYAFIKNHNIISFTQENVAKIQGSLGKKLSLAIKKATKDTIKQYKIKNNRIVQNINETIQSKQVKQVKQVKDVTNCMNDKNIKTIPAKNNSIKQYSINKTVTQEINQTKQKEYQIQGKKQKQKQKPNKNTNKKSILKNTNITSVNIDAVERQKSKERVKIEQEMTVSNSKQNDQRNLVKQSNMSKFKVQNQCECLIEQYEMQNLMGSELLFQTKFQLICALRQSLQQLLDDILSGDNKPNDKYNIIIKVLEMNMLNDLDIVYGKICQKMITIHNAYKVRRNNKWTHIIRSIDKRIKKINDTLNSIDNFTIDVTDLSVRIKSMH